MSNLVFCTDISPEPNSQPTAVREVVLVTPLPPIGEWDPNTCDSTLGSSRPGYRLANNQLYGGTDATTFVYDISPNAKLNHPVTRTG